MKIARLTRSESSGANRAGHNTPSTSRYRWPILAAAVVAVLAIAHCIAVIVPIGPARCSSRSPSGFLFRASLAAWLMYAPGEGRGIASWVVGPIWGYGISSLVLLGAVDGWCAR